MTTQTHKLHLLPATCLLTLALGAACNQSLPPDAELQARFHTPAADQDQARRGTQHRLLVAWFTGDEGGYETAEILADGPLNGTVNLTIPGPTTTYADPEGSAAVRSNDTRFYLIGADEDPGSLDVGELQSRELFLDWTTADGRAAQTRYFLWYLETDGGGAPGYRLYREDYIDGARGQLDDVAVQEVPLSTVMELCLGACGA